MSAIITANIVGSDKVTSGLESRKSSAMGAIERAVKSSALSLVAYIKKEKLSGQVLNVKTGTLRRSITARFETAGNEIRAYVGTNLKYARIHEYGFKGQVPVKAHQRMMNVAWGRRVKEPRMIDVRAHAMKMNVPARPFMAPSLAENREKISSDIRRALVGALR